MEFEEIESIIENRLRHAIEDPPLLELKKLPNRPEYAFLGKDSKLPLIMALDLKASYKRKLLKVLGEHKRAIA